MRRLSALLFGVELDPTPQVQRRGLPVEMRWAGETVWVGQMYLDMPPLEMVPDVCERASKECFGSSGGSYQWWPLHGRTHPNDFTGYPAIIGDPTTWIMVIDVKKLN